MGKIWEFYEDLEEIVYVSDIDTYEMVYMNRWARELYGFRSVKDCVGKKCYKVLHGCFGPCAFCTNQELGAGRFKEWLHYNALLGKYYSLKDTLIEEDGRHYRMEIAIDMTVQKQQSRTIQEYAENEEMINEGLRIARSVSGPDRSIAALLEYLGHALCSDRVYIFEETKSKTLDNTYEWCAPGVAPQKDKLQGVPFDVVKLWYEHFIDEKTVIIADLEDIRYSDPRVYAYLKPQGIHSLVVGPLINDHQTIGFYGVDDPPGDMLGHISVMFQILGHFMAAMLENRDLVKRLEHLSFYDHLTEFGNRHAMNAHIASMRKEESIGILYCAVMGLKRVNDAEGHEAGDQLLSRACQCLRKAFDGYPLFRLGGDEFLALCNGIEEEELPRRVEILKKDMWEHNALMALGYTWRPCGDMDMDLLLAEADDRMYEDKRAYYQAHPDVERRAPRG